MIKTKYLLAGAAVLALVSSYGTKKTFDATHVLQHLQTTLRTIRKVGFTATGINLVIDVTITNPTDKDLSLASYGAVTVKKLLIHNKEGDLVATAQPNIKALSIAPRGSVVLENIPLTAAYGDILNVIFGGFSTNPDDYTVTAEIEALGKTITV